MAILFAASHPERTRALVLYGSYAMVRRQADFPWGRSDEWLADYERQIDQDWGSGLFLSQVAPSRAEDESFRRWWGRLERLSYGPGNALAYFRMNAQIDVRSILPTIRVPTLVLQRAGDVYRDPGHATYLAAHIPGAKLVELSGVDHLPYVGDSDSVLDEVEEFLTGVRPPPEHDRVLATVLFTDIVGSTERLAALGDVGWKDLVLRHHSIVRDALTRWRGVENDTAGDGFFATFDGPARAIRCAQDVVGRIRDLGIEIRAGVHTGECEVIDGKAGGIAVSIGARVASTSGPSQILVSQTVKDLVAGSGLAFEDAGEHELKGVPDRWHLYTVKSERA